MERTSTPAMRPEAADDFSADIRTPCSERHALKPYPRTPADRWRTDEKLRENALRQHVPRGLGVGEEFQRRGVDDLRPFDESEVSGVGYLQVAAVRDGVSDLFCEVRGQHHVVREADDEY